MLFIEAEHDLFADKQAIEELAAAWKPEIWRIPHGHISALFSLPLMNRTAKWIAGKMLGSRPETCRDREAISSHVRDTR